jgi:hypothetical protein
MCIPPVQGYYWKVLKKYKKYRIPPTRDCWCFADKLEALALKRYDALSEV